MQNEKNKPSMNPVVSGIAGAAFGAAATAAVFAMKDKKTRDNISKGLNDLKTKGNQKLNELSKNISKTAKDVKEKVEDLDSRKD